MNTISKGLPILKVLDASSGSGMLPPGASHAFAYLHYFHQLYRWNNHWKEVTSSSANLTKYFSGVAVNWAFGEGSTGIPLRVAAQILLISRNLMDCIEQQAKLRNAYTKWCVACTLKNSIAISKKIPLKKEENSLVSITYWLGSGPSFALKIQLHLTAKRVIHVVSCTFILLREGLIMSHHLILLVESTSFKKEKSDEAMNCMFLNVSRLLDGVCENKELLLTELQNHEPLINRVFESMECDLSAEVLIDGIEKTLDVAASGKKVVDDSTNLLVSGGGEIVKAMGQTLFSFIPIQAPKALYSTAPTTDDAPKKQKKRKIQKWDVSLDFGQKKLKKPKSLNEIEQRALAYC